MSEVKGESTDSTRSPVARLLRCNGTLRFRRGHIPRVYECHPVYGPCEQELRDREVTREPCKREV